MNRREKSEEKRRTGSVNGAPSSDPLIEKIRLRAFELYERRGETHGQDAEDWFEAERQIRTEVANGFSGSDS
jgi:hypothetical protein